jgi:hypothetical protein
MEEEDYLESRAVLETRAREFGLARPLPVSEGTLLEEAKLAGPFEYSRVAHTLQRPGSLADRQRTTEQGILDFFRQTAGVDLAGSMCPRLDPDYSTCVVLLDTLHLYGADFMSTKRLMRYLGLFEPYKLDWVNESACNAVYESPTKARKALLNNLRYPEALPEDEEIIVIDEQAEPYIQNKRV